MNKLLLITLLIITIFSKRVVHKQDDDDDDKLEQCIEAHCQATVLACNKECLNTFSKCIDGLNEHPTTEEEDEQEQQQFDQCIAKNKKAQKLAQCIQSNCDQENQKKLLRKI